MEFNKRTNLRDFDKIIISNFNDSSVNGTRWVKQLTDFRYWLFTDKDLTVPLTNIRGVNIEGGTIKKEVYNYGTPLNSDNKISEFNQGTIQSPVYESSDGEIKISPENCLQVTVDYFAKPKVEINLTDTVVDLTLVYPFSFINRLIDEAVILYSGAARDQLLESSTTREETRNGS